jgi:Ca-activated chloride channel family protein
MGRPESVPIPLQDGGFKTDRGGEMVTTALDEATLQKVALETGGVYTRSVTGDVDLEAIYDQDIRVNLQAQELSSQMRKRWQEGFQFFLAPALAVLGVALAL